MKDRYYAVSGVTRNAVIKMPSLFPETSTGNESLKAT